MSDSLPARPSRLAVLRLCGALLVAAMCAGCVSKSKANAQAREAYLAGQREGMMRMQQAQMQSQGPCVTINGDVRNHIVPWTEGLTVIKALVAAEYYGPADPGQVIIVRQGIATRLDARQLLSGTDFPLQPGDIVQLIPRTGVPRK